MSKAELIKKDDNLSKNRSEFSMEKIPFMDRYKEVGTGMSRQRSVDEVDGKGDTRDSDKTADALLSKKQSAIEDLSS